MAEPVPVRNLAVATRGGFAAGLAAFGDRVAVVTEAGETVSYASLATRVDAFAAQLGTRPRLVLIEAANDLATLEAYLGALRGGHVALLTAEGASARDPRLIENYRPDARFTRTGDAAPVLALDPPGHDLHPDLAVLLSTSGSTGATKLVRLSAGAVDANAASIVDYLGIAPADRAMTTLPIHYSYGLSVVNSHLRAGASLLLTGRSVIDPEFWLLAERHAVTALAGVPYTYELFDRCGFMDKPLPALRTLTQAGGRLPAESVRRYADWASARGVAFFVMYGQTEATARMAYLPPDRLAEHPDCIGVAIPGGAFSLIDGDGAEIAAAGTPGELVYRGPNVMMGYAADAADLARGAEIEALATGDIAERTTDGLYRIVGRTSRFCKPFGLRISLDEVEAALRRHGWRGVAAGDDGLIAIETLESVSPATVAEALAADFKLAPALFAVAPVTDYRLLPSGKIDYRAMLAAAKAGRAAAEPDDAAAAIAAAFSRAFNGHVIDPGDSFAALGGDSLSYVNFAIEIEDRLGYLPDDWEQMSLAELQGLAAAPRRATATRRWQTLDSEIVLRAAAIIAVVINHASTIVVGGGASVLLMLAGFSIARFQRPRLERGEVWPMVRGFVTRIILPYYAILVVYLVMKRHFDWSALLLIGNFTGHFRTLIEPYWFLEALLQCTLIVAGLFAVPPVRRFAARDPWRFGVALLAGAVAVKAGAFAIFHHDRLFERTPDAVFYLLALGWCLYFANTTPRRLLLFAFVLVAALAELAGPDVTMVWNTMPWPANLSHDVWLVGSVSLLMWLPRLSLPRRVAGWAVAIASASYYIYLVHGVPVYVMLQIFHRDWLPVTLALSLGLGLAVAELARRWRGRDTTPPV